MSDRPQLEGPFDPKEIEGELYSEWEEKGYFAPSGDGPPFSIALPPPNVTGTLHVGQAFQQTLMDAIIRYRRMTGCDSLWQTGTDHAGIATQMVVTEQIRAQGLTPQDLGREAFIDRVWQWKRESGGTITQQMRRIGASVDWERERFTLDEGFSKAVIETFVRLYNDGLIYKGTRLVNWDPEFKTALSDLEVVTEPEQGHLWNLRYPLADGLQASDGSSYVVVATTRPETMLGDTAVAVNPDDERYRDLIGKHVDLPLAHRRIPIIADTHVDPEFGSGCLKITPGHDFDDNEIGQRHELEVINIFTTSATLNDNVPESFRGLDRFEARKTVISALEEADLLESVEDYSVNIPRGDRSGAIVEPLLTSQWFVKIDPLAEEAIRVVEDGTIKFVPKRWENVYFAWMRNIRDWCISRQQWWGHQIPAWYDSEGNIYVGRDEQDARTSADLANDIELTRDSDVLETWFSSALWTFGTLGWPNPESPDLKTYHPTSVLVTGHDIIFFWVARMVMMTLYLTGEIPFHTVYITGLIRDAEGKKMSKTAGNGLDPLDLVDGIDLEGLVKKRITNLPQPSMAPRIEAATRRDYPDGIRPFGADALRFTFCDLASPSSNYNFDIARVEGNHYFCNKIWNATKFVLTNTDKMEVDAPKELSIADRWIRSRMRKLVADCRRAFDDYRFDFCAKDIYEFVWHEYCDWYLELTKPVLYDDTVAKEFKQGALFTLVEVLELSLRISHPVMPFITDFLWRKLKPLTKATQPSIMLATYPEVDSLPEDREAEDAVDWLKTVIQTVRNIRGERRISPSDEVRVLFSDGSSRDRELAEQTSDLLRRLAKVSVIDWLEVGQATPAGSVQSVGQLRINVPFLDDAELQAEKSRIQKELARIDREMASVSAKLSNQQFVERAPQDVVQVQRDKASDLESQRSVLVEQAAELPD